MPRAVLADRPIEAGLHAILAHAKAATQALGTEVFVGGAMARDIMLTHVHGQAVRRATRDVDIGLYIDSWERFAALKDRLAATGAFFAVQGKSHRMHYLRPGGIPLDLIPFGGVAGEDQTITWPPGHDVVLNVAGFREGLDSADLVDLGAGLAMHVCTLPSLSVLKLLAWRDRGRDNNKDATDFLALAQAYATAGNMDRLYDEEAGLLEMAGHAPTWPARRCSARTLQCCAARAPHSKCVSFSRTLNQCWTPFCACAANWQWTVMRSGYAHSSRATAAVFWGRLVAEHGGDC